MPVNIVPVNIVTLYLYASSAYETLEAAQAAQSQNPGHGGITKVIIETPAFEPMTPVYEGGKDFQMRQFPQP